MLSEEEKARIRYHLEYPNLAMQPSMSIGAPLPTPFSYMLQQAFNMILPAGEEIIRRVLTECDKCDQEISDARVRLKASKAEGIEMREDEIDQLRREYGWWAVRLARQLGSPIAWSAEIAHFLPSQTRGPNVGAIGVRH